MARLVCLVLLACTCLGSTTGTGMSLNPIRRVVSMLQMMQKKVEGEGKTETEMFDKFMCYCKNGGGSLRTSIDAAETKIPQTESDLKAATAEKSQLASDITSAKADQAAARKTMSEGTAIRDKEASAFAKQSSEQKANVAAMGKALTAIAKGSSGFLQTPAATVLKRLAVSTDLTNEARETLTSFLSEGSSSEDSDDEPAGGEITGILGQMKETMEKDMADAAKDEAAAIKDFDALMAAKTKENDALTKEVESKTARLGETGVKMVNFAEDLDDTKKGLAKDTQFLADLDKSCKTKTAEFEELQKTRGEELVALADTIKLLNDDDTLDLMKKTLPSASFLQLEVTSRQVVRHARQVLHAGVHDYRLNLISMAMRGKAVNFQKVLTMIDDMVGLLKKEQVDDEKKKAYCAKSLDKADDEMKSLTRSEGNLKKTIANMKEVVATSVEELEALEKSIKELDASVAQATANRKEENTAYKEELAANNAAVEIIGIAKNRMNKFYNPKLYKAPPTTPAPAFIEDEYSFVQISAHQHGAKESSSGVIGMMDRLIADVQKKIAEMKFDEKDAQQEYEGFMKDSTSKRAGNAKSVAEKEATKADAASKLQKSGEELKATIGELYANGEYTHNLHGECDWLVQNFDVRKSARAGEVDSLTKAKAVLSGADSA